jgi:hypothetical protein
MQTVWHVLLMSVLLCCPSAMSIMTEARGGECPPDMTMHANTSDVALDGRVCHFPTSLARRVDCLLECQCKCSQIRLCTICLPLDEPGPDCTTPCYCPNEGTQVGCIADTDCGWPGGGGKKTAECKYR